MTRQSTRVARSPWERALELLRRRDRSEAQVRAHLAAADVSEEETDAVIERLRQHRYLDDERYAVLVVERLMARGHGRERARRDLEQACVSGDLIENAIEQAYAAEETLARQVLAARFRSPIADRDRARAARFLHGRGFPEGIMLAILGEGC